MPESQKRRFDARDFDLVAEATIDEYSRRKRNRKDREKHWEEIDRQVEMLPDIEFKKLPGGKIDHKKAWMAEMELPLQAQALEVLVSDARRMMFAQNAPWFMAHAELTDDYLNRVDFESMVLGDQTEVPSVITQDNADKLVQGFQLHCMRQYDFLTRVDRVNAESFKYGMGVARARMQTKQVFIHEAKGTKRQKQRLPVFVPGSIKRVYLDDPDPSSMYSDEMLSPSHIAEDWIRLASLQKAAAKGSRDPDDPDGGWIPEAVNALEADKDGFVHILEMEGDMVVPRKTVRDFIVPGSIVTVAVGGEKGGKVSRKIIRFRTRKHPFSSYIQFPYHYEESTEVYPVSPLMKGRPIQIMATDALNRLMDSAALKNSPPVGYDSSDMTFARTGGPMIHPNAQWDTTDPVQVYDEIGGDTGALSGVFSLGVNLYAELTGVLPARLGAQTKSHTTAFAKDAEIQRGATRTVDYVNATGEHAINRWLDMSYTIGRDAMPANEKVAFYIDAYDGFVEVDKDMLPERSSFEWFGAGGPAEEQAKLQSKLQSLQLALQMDQIQMQAAAARGEPPLPVVDVQAAIQQVLRDGKWTDLDVITRAREVAGGAAAAPDVPGAGPVNEGATIAALQAIGTGAA